MTTLPDTTRVLRADRVVFRPQAGRSLVYRPADDHLYLVPVLAERIVRRCDGSQNLAAVLESLGICEQTVGADGVAKVLALVSGLMDRHILRLVD